MNRVESATKSLVKYVTNTSAAAQFGRLDVPGRAFDGRTVGGGELRYDLQQCLSLFNKKIIIKTIYSNVSKILIVLQRMG